MTYRRLPEGEVSDTTQGRSKADEPGNYADDLNEFRRQVHLSMCDHFTLYVADILTQYFTKNQPSPGTDDKPSPK